MVISIFFIISILMLIFVPNGLMAFQFGHPLQIFQIITHMFAHANWGHLLGNYAFVLPFALYVEQRLGKREFIKSWFICGLSAWACQTFYSLILMQDRAGMIGSSGAAFGIAALALCLQDHSKWFKIAARTYLGYHLSLQTYYAYTILTDPFLAMFVRVAFAAHIGGMLAGVGLAIKHFHDKKKKPHGKSARKSRRVNKAV